MLEIKNEYGLLSVSDELDAVDNDIKLEVENGHVYSDIWLNKEQVIILRDHLDKIINRNQS